MSASRPTTRPEPDQRLLVLVAVGLALCLGPLLWRTLFPPTSSQAFAPPVYLWLTGGGLPDGLYRLPPGTWQPEAAAAGYGLADSPLASDFEGGAARSLAALRFQPNDPPAAAALPPSLAPFFFAPIAVNHADRELLMTLPGVGPRLADGIIALREQKKELHHLDELLGVRGIGKAKIASLEGMISFD